MPLLNRVVSIITSRPLFTFLNAGIILCSFVESYIFPFAVVKWMIVITKYGGLVNLLKDCSVQQRPTRSLYKYSLRLITACTDNRVKSNIERPLVSHVSFVAEDYGGELHRTQLSYCGQDCKKIPPALGKMYGAKVHCLDLSYNSIETLKGLDQFTRLEELILDNNKVGDGVGFPYLPSLKTLSLNNNQISELEPLLDTIRETFPSLTYLSLLSNKACPNQLSDVEKDDCDYQRYRYFVIYKLPCLRFLDSRRIWSEERAEALRRGEFARVRRPAAAPPPAAAPAPAPPAARPLPVDLAALGKHKGAYGKCNYKYTGKHSEGNRFIVNSDL